MVRGRVLERALQRGVADQQPRVGLLAERDVPGLGQQHLASARPRSRSRASRRRSAPARAACARRAGSSRRRPRRRRRAAAAAAAGRRDARTRSRRSARGRARRPSSRAFSSVGTPCTSSTSASSRKKTGAMFTYEMRPSRITPRPTGRRSRGLPSLSRVANSRVPKSVASTPSLDTGWSTSLPRSSLVELVDSPRRGSGSCAVPAMNDSAPD